MTIKQIMERVGLTETGRAVAYIKDALEEINVRSETHITTSKISLAKDQRLYDIPNHVIQIKDVRVKNHLNSKDEYRSISRLIHKPLVKDADGV